VRPVQTLVSLIRRHASFESNCSIAPRSGQRNNLWRNQVREIVVPHLDEFGMRA
jgi:hypothetical protein